MAGRALVGRVRWLFVAGLTLVLCAGTSAEDHAADRPLQPRVDEAIDRGVAWLSVRQRQDGTFPLSPGHLGNKASANWAGGPWDKGLDALCVYALAVCDVPPDSPVLERGLAALRVHWDNRLPPSGDITRTADGISTYFVSLCLLSLDAHYNRGVGQLKKGPPNPKRAGRDLMGKRDYEWANELVDWLAFAQDPGADAKNAGALTKRRSRRTLRGPKASSAPSFADGGGFGYESGNDFWTHHDHSNSQFAVLGMKAAARLGVAVPDAMWLRALRHFIASQETDGPEVDRVDALDAAGTGRRSPRKKGATFAAPVKDRARGWGYMCQGSSFDPTRSEVERFHHGATGTMTTGGVSTLVICRSELEGVKGFTGALRSQTETAIRDGLAWLARDLANGGEHHNGPSTLPPEIARKFSISSDPLDDFYFLYGLERACMLASVSHLGDVAWWRTGAERIVSCQNEAGAFHAKSKSNGNGYPEIDTCFALLFLKRAVFRTVDKRVETPSTK